MHGLVAAMLQEIKVTSMHYVPEVVVDSTHNLTNGNYEMFTIIVPFKGEGYPLAYMFIEKDST
jgi:hypothetical protein